MARAGASGPLVSVYCAIPTAISSSSPTAADRGPSEKSRAVARGDLIDYLLYSSADHIMLLVDFVQRPDAMSDVGRILQQARQELLDLSGRNRLIDTPRHRTRTSTIEVMGERSEAVFRLPGRRRQGHELPSAPRAHEAIADAGRRGCAREDLLATWRRRPRRFRRGRASPPPGLWTTSGCRPSSAPSGCRAACCASIYDARSHYEERGVGVLYLALGFLEWYETPTARSPPRALILVPVRLERGSAAERFRLWFADEEIPTNLR